MYLVIGQAFEEKDVGRESRGLAPLQLGSPPAAPLPLEHIVTTVGAGGTQVTPGLPWLRAVPRPSAPDVAQSLGHSPQLLLPSVPHTFLSVLFVLK